MTKKYRNHRISLTEGIWVPIGVRKSWDYSKNKIL